MKHALALWLLAAALLLITDAANAERRKGNFDVTLGAASLFSEKVGGAEGSSLDIDSNTGIQAGIDYYLTNRLSVGFDMSWLNPRYTATLVPEDGSPDVTVSHRSTIFNGQFSAAYDLMDGPFTPFAEAGIGWTYFDSNVLDSDPIVGCWWDPFWGYICDAFYSTYSDTNFSYHATLGFRWDFSMEMFAKASYRWLEVDLGSGAAKPMMEQALLEIGWRF
jgi:opacity protein-like surface antigen